VSDPWEQARSQWLIDVARGMIQAATIEFGASRRFVSFSIDSDQLSDAHIRSTSLAVR
jgi:hypothetical protein